VCYVCVVCVCVCVCGVCRERERERESVCVCVCVCGVCVCYVCVVCVCVCVCVWCVCVLCVWSVCVCVWCVCVCAMSVWCVCVHTQTRRHARYLYIISKKRHFERKMQQGTANMLLGSLLFIHVFFSNVPQACCEAWCPHQSRPPSHRTSHLSVCVCVCERA
jgi:hypothetical protein